MTPREDRGKRFGRDWPEVRLSTGLPLPTPGPGVSRIQPEPGRDKKLGAGASYECEYIGYHNFVFLHAYGFPVLKAEKGTEGDTEALGFHIRRGRSW